MIYSDNILERNHVVLRNLNTNTNNVTSDTWSPASSSYGFYSIPYEIPLASGHYYYYRYTYKFTTTNQSPTWCRIYNQGGSNSIGDTAISNPVAGTEYTKGGIAQPNLAYTLTSGTIYNGDSGKISGVSSQVKNVLCYDVTELYSILLSKGIVSTTATLRTWCDDNLVHKPMKTPYDISDLIADDSAKLGINKGDLVAEEFIECDGMTKYSYNDTIRNNVYFDSGNGLSVYNNSGGGTVTHTRVAANTVTPLSPFAPKHPTILKITTNGTASPGAGGFICQHTAKANGIFVEKFVALIPTGYTVGAAANGQGTGGTYSIVGSNAGTGQWEEYTVLYKCGSEGSFSTGGHVYISGSNNTSVTWYLAYANNCDISGKEYLKNYTVMPKMNRINDNHLFSRSFDCRNILPNGDCAVQETAMLPSGWSYDTTDYAGNASCSLVQPVNAGSGTFGGHIKINPLNRYKISYWVKCKGDMTSFLTAIYYYTSNGTGLAHSNVMYKNGTYTQLTAALNSGDTTVTVKSNANWASRSLSKLGFRSNGYKCYNDLGQFGSNIVSGVTGSTTINLASAYTGSTIASGKYIVEGYDGGNYPYPIQKSVLPTDNTWKYVEGYFGAANVAFYGADNNGAWYGIPFETVEMAVCLNLYQNTGTVPIKFCDIRIEPVSGTGGNRQIQKIQFHG